MERNSLYPPNIYANVDQQPPPVQPTNNYFSQPAPPLPIKQHDGNQPAGQQPPQQPPPYPQQFPPQYPQQYPAQQYPSSTPFPFQQPLPQQYPPQPGTAGYYPPQPGTAGYYPPPQQPNYPGPGPQQQQQQQTSVVVVNAGAPQPFVAPARQSYGGHIVFACVLFWFCGGNLFALIGFILAGL